MRRRIDRGRVTADTAGRLPLPRSRAHASAACARRALVGCVAVSLFAAGCASFRGKTGSDEAVAKSPPAPAGEVAPLRAIGGSAVSGKIRVIDRGDGASVLVSAMNMPRNFRIAIHENPNCTSPNGFSAGPAWAPAGKQPEELAPPLIANSEDRVEAEFRIPGLHATGPNGVAGRSVVVYAGSRVTAARPDVPNDRIACGVFEPAQLLAF